MIQLMKKVWQVKMKYTNCSLSSTNVPLEAVNYDGRPEKHIYNTSLADSIGVITIPEQFNITCKFHLILFIRCKSKCKQSASLVLSVK